MNGREIEQARWLAREKALYRYTSALERGDFQIVSLILKEAEQDPALERMLLEMNEVFQAEMEVQPARATHTLSQDTSQQGFFRLFWWTRKDPKKEQKAKGDKSCTKSLRLRRDLVRNSLIVGGTLFAIALIFLVGSSIYTLSGRSGGDTAADEVPAPGQSPPARAPHIIKSGDIVKSWGLSQPVERLIIRSGSISMVIEDTRVTRLSIEEMVTEMAEEGAYVVSSEEYGEGEESLPYIAMAIRIPAARFDEAMDRLANLAVQVTARHESGQDVTEEYVDLEARLESLEAARQRLLEIMQDAQMTDELLKAEQQLTQRETEIESLKGRMQYLAQSARFASIHVELRPYSLSQPVGVHWRPAEAARQAFETLIDSLQSLGDFMIFFAIAVLPWAVLLGLAAYGIVRFVLWRIHAGRKNRAAGD